MSLCSPRLRILLNAPVAWLLATTLLGACQGGFDKTYELQPKASESFTLESKQDLKVGWDLVEDGAGMNCPDQNCIKLDRKDDFGYIGGQFGAAMNFKPKDGKMSFTVENLAPFALKVRVYAKKP